MKRWQLCVVVLVLTFVTMPLVAQNPKRQPPQRDGQQRNPAALLQRFDANQNGVLEASEIPEQLRRRMDQIDANKDGKISREELQRISSIRPAGDASGSSSASGERNTPPARGERFSDRLKVGDMAPDFTLSDPKGERQVTLSSFRGQKPVVLIFGSYT